MCRDSTTGTAACRKPCRESGAKMDPAACLLISVLPAHAIIVPEAQSCLLRFGETPASTVRSLMLVLRHRARSAELSTALWRNSCLDGAVTYVGAARSACPAMTRYWRVVRLRAFRLAG